jgi:HEAT repeat protein
MPSPHSRICLAVLSLTFVITASIRADDDPTIRGRKLSAWFKFMRDEPDARLRQVALHLVDSEGGPKVGAVLSGLVQELKENKDTALRLRIAELLPRYQERADEVVSALKSALQHDAEGKVREASAISLGKLDRVGFSAVKELGDALKDKDSGTRAAAAQAIGAFSRTDPEIGKEFVSTLAGCLRDDNAAVRLQSAFALGRMGAAAESAVSALGEALPKDKDAAVRKEIAKSLASLGTTASGASAALIDTLQDRDVEVRQAVAIALARVGPPAETALPKLLKAAHDPDKSVRCHAIHALGALGKPAVSAIPDLIDILRKDEAADVRLAAIEELASFGQDAKAAIDALTVASKDGRTAVRDAAQEALKKIKQSP